MAFLIRLPLMLLELLLRRVFGSGDDTAASVVTPEAARAAATSAPAPSPPAEAGGGAFTEPTANGAPPPTAEEAIERRRAREAAAAAAPDPEPPTPPRPIGDAGHVDREAAVVESLGPAEDVGGTITIDPPWPSYDRDSAEAIVERLRGADTATKGVVALYERAHKKRATVLRAAG
ncbi:MAG TPA: hypothetical protein VNT03_13110 [Baekduia sp.]|nr:hypothetical protein [Baekduia sp.]